MLFQRSPLRRSRTVESTPGVVCTLCPSLARWTRLLLLAEHHPFVGRLPPPACSDLVVSRHFAGFLLVDPVRTVAAAHDPGVHRRFTSLPLAPRPRCRARRSRDPPDPRDVFLPFEAFPPTPAVVDDVRFRSIRAGLLLRSSSAPLSSSGRLSPPARPSPRSAARLVVALVRRGGLHLRVVVARRRSWP